MISLLKHAELFLQNYNTFFKDIFFCIIIFLATVIAVYALPYPILFIFQSILLLSFSLQKKYDYFWIAFLFVIESQPGGLFSILDPENTFSFFRGGTFGQLYFWMIFLAVCFLKTIKRLPDYKLFFRNILIVLFFYFFFLLAVYGINTITSFIRFLLPWAILIFIPLMLKNLKDFARFFNIIFAFVFINLITQIIELFLLTNVSALLGGNIRQILYAESKEVIARPVYGIYIPLFAFIGALFFNTIKYKFFKKNYLNLIIIISLLSLFITATRGYFFAALFIFVVYYLIISRHKIKTISRLLAPVLIILVLINFVPFLKQQLEQALIRFETIQYLFQGDLSAGGTLQRIDIRSPKVMEKFYESPIIGFGYGKEAFIYSDGHVGNQNLLLHTGVVGYVLFLIFWIYFVIKLLRREKNLSVNNPFKGTLILSVIIFIGIFIIHTASRQVFNFLIDIQWGLVLFIFLSFVNYLYYISARLEYLLRKEKIILYSERHSPRYLFH